FLLLFVFFSILRSPPISALFPYTTLFRSFCVGTSLLNPAKPFMDLWYRVNQDFPDYKLHLVSFEDDHNGILSEIEKLGDKFDFLDRKSTRLNSSHVSISYAVFCLKKKTNK